MEKMSRKEAISKNLPHYYTGVPCKFGHISKRVVSNYCCLECAKIRARIAYQNDPENAKATQKRSYLKNRENRIASVRKWQKSNPDKHRATKERSRELENKKQREWRKINPEAAKERDRQQYLRNTKSMNAAARRWQQAHPDRVRAIVRSACRSRKHLITKQEISKNFSKQILEIYANCPVGHHVDHIIPLKGKTVTGLHVPWNLQYLLVEDNLRKGNRFIEGEES